MLPATTGHVKMHGDSTRSQCLHMPPNARVTYQVSGWLGKRGQWGWARATAAEASPCVSELGGGGRATDTGRICTHGEGAGPRQGTSVPWPPGLGYSPGDGRVHFVHQRHRQHEGVVVQRLGALHVAAAGEEAGAQVSMGAPTGGLAPGVSVPPPHPPRAASAPPLPSPALGPRAESRGGTVLPQL